jgi:hypothetical protein
MARKDEQNNAQFDTGFGSAAGGTFGGSAGAPPRSQAAMGGEFSNGFGGGTNAVSQIFRDGGMGADDKRRKLTMGILVGVALFVIGGSAYVFFMDEGGEMSTETPTVATTPAAVAPTKTDAADEAKEAEGTDELAEEDGEGLEGEEEAEELASEPGEMSSSGTYTYNEMGGGPIVSAPAGTSIEVSRLQDFSVMYMTGTVGNSGKLRIPNPPPGKVYWRESGKSEMTEITIEPAPKLNLSMSLGASIGASDTVKWDADGEVAYYRLEMAGDASFSNISHSFSTSKSQVALSGVNPGTYFVRVGGLNVASGRWEFTSGSSVEVK